MRPSFVARTSESNAIITAKLAVARDLSKKRTAQNTTENGWTEIDSPAKIAASQMSEIADRKLEQRFQRNTYIFILVALLASACWSGWRLALGVALGGTLSLFNKNWLQGSVQAILSYAAEKQDGRVPPFTAGKIVFRYYIIALAIGGAIWTGDFHPLGIAIGFAAFVGGVMIEAVYQLYLAFRPPKATSPEQVGEHHSSEE